MPKNKEIEITLTLKDEATKKIQSFRSGVKEFSKETKDSLAPVLQLRRTWMYTSIAIGATVGTFIKGAQEIAKLREEYIKLDTTAIKLGISSEQLSKKLYGFNIGTFYARIGVDQISILFDDFKNTITFLKTKAAEEIGKFNIDARAQQIFQKKGAFNLSDRMTEKGFLGGILDWWKSGEERKKILEESREEAKKEALEKSTLYNEIQAIKTGKATEAENKIQQLSLSTYEYQKYLLNQDLENYKIAGVNKLKLAEYQALQERQILYVRFGFTKWSDYMDGNFRSTIGSMRETLSTFFNDTFTGELQKGEAYFAQFGNNILKIFSQTIAEMITRWAILGEGFGKSGFGQWGGIASSLAGLFSPAGTIIGGVGGITTMTSQFGKVWSPYKMAEGGQGIVKKPTLFLAGEEGPELYRFAPVNKMNSQEREGGNWEIHIHNEPTFRFWDMADVYAHKKEIIAIFSESARLQAGVIKALKKNYKKG
ncbi:MAG: hypothetical protein PHC54_05490 [Candidatus Omnitrophica bacterium]|nr:hypothetical protein [Candidatus Omnitrophota bacterium]MDD5592646.1 hypothetical protein [Candidatus Omnitrophota bacterium]